MLVLSRVVRNSTSSGTDSWPSLVKRKHEDYVAMELNNGTWAWRFRTEMKFEIRERERGREESTVINEKY